MLDILRLSCYDKTIKRVGRSTMKKLFALIVMLIGTFIIGGCDIIEEEIERAQSLKLEDYSVDIPNQTISLKITSEADEQVIQRVVVNDVEYELTSEGDDWYLLDEVPIATAYNITDVYYQTGVGVVLSYNVNFDISLDDAMDALPVEQVTEIETEITIGEYTFFSDEAALVVIETERDHTITELDEWVWLVLEDDIPLFAVFEYNDVLYVVEADEYFEEYVE